MPWLPAAAAIVGAAASAGTAAATAANGGGGKSAPAWNTQKAGGYDPNAYAYNNAGMGAGERQRMYDQMGADAQKRQGVQLDYSQAQGQMTRGQGEEGQALQYLRDAASGNAPSLAERQLQAGLDAAVRSQESARASARGAAGVAMADYAAAGNIAMAQQQANAQAGMLRAQEMAQAREAYMQGAGAARGRDIGSAGQMAAWQQFVAEQEMRQREMNDRRQAAMLGMGEGIAGQQLQAQLAQQSALQRAYEASTGSQERADARQAAANQQALQMGIGGASGAFNAIASAYGPQPTDPKKGKP